MVFVVGEDEGEVEVSPDGDLSPRSIPSPGPVGHLSLLQGSRTLSQTARDTPRIYAKLVRGTGR